MPIAIGSGLQKFINDSQTDAKAVQDAIVRRSGMPTIVTVGEASTQQAPTPVASQDEQQAQAEALQPTEESVMPKLVQPGPVYSENN